MRSYLIVLATIVLAIVAGRSYANNASIDTAVLPQFHNHTTVDLSTGHTISASGTVVYDNTPSAPNGGISSGNLATIWGDTLNMTGSGRLQEMTLTIFNSTSGGNVGNYVSSNLAVSFQRLSDSSLIGGFNGTLDFSGDPLPPGFYSLITFTGLDSLALDIDTADVIVTQQLANVAGGTTRMGVVSLNPVVIGGSPVSFYMDDPSAPPAGFYTVNGGATPIQLGYLVSVPEPAVMSVLALGGLLGLIRRR